MVCMVAASLGRAIVASTVLWDFTTTPFHSWWLQFRFWPTQLSLCLRNYWGINESYVTLQGLKMRRHYRCNFRLLSLNGHESAMRKTQRTHRYTQSQPLPPSHTLSMTNGGTTMRQIPTTGVGGEGSRKKEKECYLQSNELLSATKSPFWDPNESSDQHDPVLHAEIKIWTYELFFSTPSFKNPSTKHW